MNQKKFPQNHVQSFEQLSIPNFYYQPALEFDTPSLPVQDDLIISVRLPTVAEAIERALATEMFVTKKQSV